MLSELIRQGVAGQRPLCSNCETRESSRTHMWCSKCLADAKRERYARYISEGRCKRCGKPNDTTNKMCSSCYETVKNDGLRRKRERKEAAVWLFGGRCSDCGIESPHREIYDFHHINPDDKEHSIAQLFQSNWESILAELRKCVLLCANCHRIREHSGENS